MSNLKGHLVKETNQINLYGEEEPISIREEPSQSFLQSKATSSAQKIAARESSNESKERISKIERMLDNPELKA